jgi:hypothetical protein
MTVYLKDLRMHARTRATMRYLPVLVAFAMLTACSAGASGGNNPSVVGTSCSPGTQLALAVPFSNETGVPTSTNQIVVVANGNGNYLFQTFANWQVVLLINNNINNSIPGGSLTLINDNGAPHPFPSDYYYASSISNLVGGQTYAVYLNQQNTSCSLVGPIGGFST